MEILGDITVNQGAFIKVSGLDSFNAVGSAYIEHGKRKCILSYCTSKEDDELIIDRLRKEIELLKRSF